MMLYEFEGKRLFAECGIPVPEGRLAGNPDEAATAAEELGLPVMVKAQLLSGGRGKAGLVRRARTLAEAVEAARAIQEIKPGCRLLVERCVDAGAEGYIGITVDDVRGCPMMVMSASGGVDVEAAGREGKAASRPVDPLEGISGDEIVSLAREAGFGEGSIFAVAELAEKLVACYRRFEADTMEINPALIRRDGAVVAADSKVVTDDYADFRQPLIEGFARERRAEGALDAGHFAYVPLGGSIGVISVGASNTMMLLDTIERMGGRPANFMDAMGSNSYEDIVNAYETLLRSFEEDPAVRAVIVNFTLTAQPLKNYAGAVAEAMERVKPQKRYVACIRATGAAVYSMSLEEGKAGLAENGAEIIDSLYGAIKRVVELAAETEVRED